MDAEESDVIVNEDVPAKPLRATPPKSSLPPPRPSLSQKTQKEPKRIQKLSTEVVNRIAAGEIIQRPANAIKELLENSFDANSTAVTITIGGGGLKYIQISDNGSGIAKEDLPIVCARHTTSKLASFEDLRTIQTFGFRGEALASISYVSHVCITSKPISQHCAYKAYYEDGVLRNNEDPKPAAGTNGTTILITDLFYNSKIKSKAFAGKEAEEYKKIVHVVTRYAVNNPTVSITLKKQGETKPDVHTSQAKTVQDTIKVLFGREVAKNLMSLEHKSEKLDFEVDTHFTNPNYNQKELSLIVFINRRLVSCPAIKKAVEQLYEPYLPKGTKPFVYMNLKMNPRNVDVNVHPSKETVHFLRENEIVEVLQQAMRQKLLSSNSSRVMELQNASAVFASKASSSPSASSSSSTTSTPSKTPIRPQNMVRTTDKDQTGQMDLYLSGDKQNRLNPSEDFKSVQSTEELSKSATAVFSIEFPKDNDDLDSIIELKNAVVKAAHEGLFSLIKQHAYVGWVNSYLSLLQHNTKLYVVDVHSISIALFYQCTLVKFKKFKKMTLMQPLNVREMLEHALAVDMEEEDLEDEEDGAANKKAAIKEEAKRYTELLQEKAEMLNEYFSIEIDSHNNLVGLPQYFNNHIPPMNRLPDFLLRLSSKVDWEEETNCFHTIATQLSLFYALPEEFELIDPAEQQVAPEEEDVEANENNMEDIEEDDEEEGDKQKKRKQKAAATDKMANTLAAGYTVDNLKWVTERVILPACKLYLRPPKDMATDGTFVEVASLANLYKVFERC